MDVQVGTTGDDYTPSYVLRPGRIPCWNFCGLKVNIINFPNDLYAIYAQEQKKALMAELNNISGLDARRMKLYVFLPQKVGTGFNLVQLLIPENIREIGAPGKATRRAENGSSCDGNYPPRDTMTGVDYA